MPRNPKAPSSPLSPSKVLSIEDARAGIVRLNKRLEELNAFDADSMQEKYPPGLAALEAEVNRSLEKTFGERTSDYNRFAQAGQLTWSPSIVLGGEPTPLHRYQSGVKSKILRARELIAAAVRSLEEDIIERGGQQAEVLPDKHESKLALSRSVFVVHGHDAGAKETVARFLEKLEFKPVILHEQPNKGRTIISKFQDEAADVGFAVVIMTPDDTGAKVGSEGRYRARQNVVFELGFFIGALGPARVAALVKGDVERPSDFDGVVYISLDDGAWKTDLGKELQAAGYEIDWNKLMRT